MPCFGMPLLTHTLLLVCIGRLALCRRTCLSGSLPWYLLTCGYVTTASLSIEPSADWLPGTISTEYCIHVSMECFLPGTHSSSHHCVSLEPDFQA